MWPIQPRLIAYLHQLDALTHHQTERGTLVVLLSTTPFKRSKDSTRTNNKTYVHID